MTYHQNTVSWRLLAAERMGKVHRSMVRRKRVIGRYDLATLRRLS